MRLSFSLQYISALMLSIAFVVSANAAIELPSLLSDGALLQADKEIRIWGQSSGEDKIMVRLGDKELAATIEENGNWLALFPALPSGTRLELKVSGTESKTVKDILIGELWLCSGQSNMEWRLRQLTDELKQEAFSRKADDEFRFFVINHRAADNPEFDVIGKWVKAEPEALKDVSGVAYFTGYEMRQKLKVPCGMITNAWGGSNIIAWLSWADIEDKQSLVDKYKKNLSTYVKDGSWYYRNNMFKKGKGEKPGPPPMSMPTVMYNGMLYGVREVNIRGVLWYQGESNAHDANGYQVYFKRMIASWRTLFRNSELPFYYVQLPNFQDRKPQPSNGMWALFREGQEKSLEIPYTGMVVTIDVGEAKDIHPKDKKSVGQRLARQVLHKTYGHTDIVAESPRFESMTVEGDKVRVSFKYVNNDLEIHGDEIVGFALAGEDKKFYWADAIIEGNQILVSSKDVSAPVAVRYAWAQNPACNVYNTEGLPLAPFRSDTWPAKK